MRTLTPAPTASQSVLISVITKKVSCFSNNKPGVTPELKALLNEKKRTFRCGGKEELRREQKELKYKIRAGKESYRRNMEESLQQNKVREVWKNMKKSGHFEDKRGATVPAVRGWNNKLNLVFNRFNSRPASSLSTGELCVLSCSLLTGPVDNAAAYLLH